MGIHHGNVTKKGGRGEVWGKDEDHLPPPTVSFEKHPIARCSTSNQASSSRENDPAGYVRLPITRPLVWGTAAGPRMFLTNACLLARQPHYSDDHRARIQHRSREGKSGRLTGCPRPCEPRVHIYRVLVAVADSGFPGLYFARKNYYVHTQRRGVCQGFLSSLAYVASGERSDALSTNNSPTFCTQLTYAPKTPAWLPAGRTRTSRP